MRALLRAVVAASIATASLAVPMLGQARRATGVNPAPSRFAVGMRRGDQLGPYTVEATSDGWVTFIFLSIRPDEGLPPPAMRMIATPAEVRRFTSRTREAIAAVDSGFEHAAVTRLGSGRFRLETVVTRAEKTTNLNLAVFACGPGSSGSGPTRSDMTDFLALLDSAADRAIKASKNARPPTLSRPYYNGEVSCPARQLTKRSEPRSAFVSGGTEVPVEFVVDTTGNVEANSFRFLPSADPATTPIVKDLISASRYEAAEVDGTPVRGAVQLTMTFAEPHGEPLWSQPDDASHVTPYGDSTGWVRLEYRFGSSVEREWFHPDTIDAFVARVQKLYEVGRARVGHMRDDSLARLDQPTTIGTTSGRMYGAANFIYRDTLQHRAGWTSCNGSGSSGDRPPDEMMFFRFHMAAERARSMRATPILAADQVLTANNVACAAWIPWSRVARADYLTVWRYPAGLFTPEIARRSPYIDVLFSVVVDSSGVIDAKTLELLSDTEPYLFDAVRTSLTGMHFRPATRSGVRVKARTIQSLRFEPPIKCDDMNAGPGCGRKYSER
jgi:hypothetical protein